ncbi:hypothetical protein U27_04125 [Candidatus Vecturithrix granuli]|uniref:non-specific protein-tyrosine kinase n=1 Tax=Vecturithrix granuli TaxID=1499967 RepID=A0A081BXV5_VECG1|nr:hypothetical protein U27_04125 [Candidatus Vecturithrix granuli]
MFDEVIQLREYVHILKKRRWIILTVTFLTVVAITIWTFRQIPIYEATTRILIEKESPNLIAFEEVLKLDTSAQDYYQTQYMILMSRSLAKEVLKKLGLTDLQRPQVQMFFSVRGIFNELAEKLGLSTPAPSPESDETIDKEERLVNEFLQSITVSPIRGSRLVDIKAISTDRQQAAMLANTLADVYIERNLDDKLVASKDAVLWLEKEVEITQKKVADSEAALQQYKEEHGILSFEERQNIIMQKLLELNTAVNEAKIKRAAIEAQYKQVQKYQSDKVESLSVVINNPLIQGLKVELANLESELSQLRKKFRDKHPNMTALQSQIDATKSRLNTEIKRIFDSLKSDYEVALAQEKDLSKMLEEQKHEAMDLNKKAIRYGELQREVESNHRVYNELLQRTKETNVTERLQTNNIRIVDHAVVPNSPIAPKKIRNILLAMVVGLTMGIGLAFFFEFWDNSIKTSDDIKQYLDMPFLGFIPKVYGKEYSNNGNNGTRAKPDMIVAIDPKSSASEAYRTLRTNVVFSLVSDEERALDLDFGSVMLVTSPGPAEGKSCIVANLGIAMAQSGSKTLIIDCDLRKPVMHKIFNVNNDRGFADMMADIKTYGTKVVVKHTKIKNLDVIPCGKIPPNPSELLGSSLARIVIEALAERYDKILIDSPPVNTVTDPILLSRIADGIVFIVHAGQTKRDVAQRARDQLLSADAVILGGVINSVDLKKDSYYYYYSYYHSHYYTQDGKKQLNAAA